MQESKYAGILSPNIFDPNLTSPELFQTEHTRRLAHLPSFCELVFLCPVMDITLMLVIKFYMKMYQFLQSKNLNLTDLFVSMWLGTCNKYEKWSSILQ